MVEELGFIDNDKDHNPNNPETELAKLLVTDEDMLFDTIEESELVDMDKGTNPTNESPSNEETNINNALLSSEEVNQVCKPSELLFLL